MGEYRFGRPRGNLLPRKVEVEPPKPCIRYFVDKEKLKDGVIEPITDPEEYTMPEDVNPYVYSDWVGNEFSCENEQGASEEMPRAISNKPSREELELDIETMTNREIADKYDVAKSTVSMWIRDYGLQRTNTEPATTEEITGVETAIIEPTLAQREEFFTDTPAEYLAEHKSEMTVEEAEEKIWAGIAIDLGILRQRMIKRAEDEFSAKLSELLESFR